MEELKVKKEKIKFNKSNIDRLPPVEKGQRVDYWDEDLTGFGLRVSATKKVFFAMARVGAKKIRVGIGEYGPKTADQARKDAKKYLGKLADGVDLNADKRKQRQRSKSLKDAYGDYLREKKLTANTLRADGSLLKHIDDWMTRPLCQITGEMVANRFKKIAASSSETNAANVMRLLRRIYNNAAAEKDASLPDNPVTDGLRKKQKWAEPVRRKSVIDNSDLPAWYSAVNQLQNPIIRDYLLLLLFTGLRKNEGLTLKWSDVKMPNLSFTIPVTKNKKPHTLPMSTAIKEIFDRRLAMRENEFVFPGHKTPKNSDSGSHLVEPGRAVDAIIASTGIKFCLHDLRRVFATAAQSEVSYTAVKRLLNHAGDKRDVTDGYIQLSIDELREPMQKVTDALLKRVAPPEGNQAEPLQEKSDTAKIIQLRRVK